MICSTTHFFDKLPLFKTLQLKYLLTGYISADRCVLIEDITLQLKQTLCELYKLDFRVTDCPLIKYICILPYGSRYKESPHGTYNINYFSKHDYGIIYDNKLIGADGAMMITNDIEKMILLDKITFNKMYIDTDTKHIVELPMSKFPPTHHELFELIQRAKFLHEHEIIPVSYDKPVKYDKYDKNYQNPLSFDFSNFQEYPLVDIC